MIFPAVPDSYERGARSQKISRGELPTSRDTPLVSIVIPTYNQADYLDESISSVLDQDYPNIELLVLDDGSTDNTREVLNKYAGQFYWETKRNTGQADTLNKGWEMSSGEVLAYLSSDDVLLPNAVSSSLRHLWAKPDTVLTYCDYNLIGVDSRFIRRVHAPECSYKDMVARVINPVGPGALFHRTAFEAAGPWNTSLRITPDYDFWLRLGLQGRFSKIPEVLASLRVHSNSQSFAKAAESKSEEYVRVISAYYKSGQVPAEVLAVKHEALSNAHIVSAKSHLRSGRYKKGSSRLIKGLYLYPRNLSFRTMRVFLRGLYHFIRYRRHGAFEKRYKGF